MGMQAQFFKGIRDTLVGVHFKFWRNNPLPRKQPNETITSTDLGMHIGLR